MNKILAENPGIGKVMLCENCDRIHFTLGRMSMELTKEEFLGLDEMIHSAAGGFQTRAGFGRGPESESNRPIGPAKFGLVH